MFKKSFLIVALALLLQTGFVFSSDTDESESASEADTTAISQDSLYALINASFQKVKPILEYSCYDCHSANTKEPWYYNLPLINSFVSSHVKEGREHLDFTNGFPFKTKESQLGILHELKEEVEEGEMPILSYRIMHWGRLIENEKQDTLFQWIDATIQKLNEHQNKK